MKFSNLQKVVTYLLAGLGLISLSFGGELALGSLALLFAGFAVSWFIEGELIARPSWSRAWNGVLLLALGIQGVRGVTGDGGWLGYAMEFAGLLSVSRLFNRRTAADYQQIAMLAFMQLIAATVLTSDLGFAGVFIAFVIVTPWVLTMAHMRVEIERNYPKEPSADGGTDAPRVLASRRVVSGTFLLWTALLSLPMLAITVGLFVIFPRVGLGFVSFGSQRGQHVAGFGNKVELGGFGVIRDDPTVVVRVTPSRPLTREEQVHYLRLRGTAFDQYDGKRWTRTEGNSVRMSPISEYYALRRMPRNGDLRFSVVLDRLDEPVLFIPPGAVGLRIPVRSVPGVPRERMRVMRSHGLDIRYQSRDELGVLYEVIASTASDEQDVPVARDTDDQRYLQLPPGHERVAALAKELTFGLTDPEQQANRLKTYLRDSERFSYSLQQPDTGDKPPLEVFLFEARRGHCEYFATALAVMLRTLGIPARNVTGFVGGEYNKYGRYFAIRQADAHSWVEAYFPERGWVTMDPTPGTRDELGPSQWLFRDLTAMVDAMRAYWMMRVVGYDLRTQVRGLAELRSFFRQLHWPDFGGERAKTHRETAREPTGQGQNASVMVALSLVAALVAAFVAAVRLLRKRRSQRALSISAREAQALYKALERVLEKQGRARPAHITPEAHARALEREGFAAAAAVRELTQVYVEARYGDLALPRERIRAVRGRLDEVRRAA